MLYLDCRLIVDLNSNIYQQYVIGNLSNVNTAKITDEPTSQVHASSRLKLVKINTLLQ